MQLAENADPAAAFAIDRYHGLQTPLEIASDPDHAGIDRSGRGVGIAKIIRNRRRKTCFDDRNKMIEKLRKLKINDLGFQIGHAVLQGCAVDQLLWNKDVLGEIEGVRGNLIAGLSGHGECTKPRKAIR